ncbi:hypothetical protein Tco_0545604 [Tanacetum coccineum]
MKKREESHRVLLHSQMSWSQKGGGEVKAEARVTEVIIVVVPAKENLLMLNVIIVIKKVAPMKFCRQICDARYYLKGLLDDDGLPTTVLILRMIGPEVMVQKRNVVTLSEKGIGAGTRS